MLTFHNDPVQKIKYQTMYKDARESGHMMRGNYFDAHTQKGCLIGLATHGEYHARFAAESGIPEWLLRLGEICFEGLPEESFTEFPEKLIDAIPIGLDDAAFEIVKHKMAVFQIEEICCDTDHPTVKQQIKEILLLHKRFIAGDFPTNEEWSYSAYSAHSAARSAYSAYSARSAAQSVANSAHSAAHSAASSAASSAAAAARSAAQSAALSTSSAAYSSASSAAYSSASEAAYSSASSAAYSAISEKLLSLLRELEPVPIKPQPIKLENKT